MTLTNTGFSGRGAGLAVEAGRSTLMSTVASGAATMKMINSTSITSMNGVTLISWFSDRSSSAPSFKCRPMADYPTFTMCGCELRSGWWSRSRLTSSRTCADASDT
ncbi:hypothetical protein D9M72_585100 [compost metagenome]